MSLTTTTSVSQHCDGDIFLPPIMLATPHFILAPWVLAPLLVLAMCHDHMRVASILNIPLKPLEIYP